MATAASSLNGGKRGIRLQNDGIDDPFLFPRDVNILRFAEARAAEMDTLSLNITSSHSNMRPLQLLPIHMRRRAMSHNAKRFPRRLQAVAEEDILAARLKSTKRPARKFRSRDHRRLKKSSQRHLDDSNDIWLRTHVWHAKRFKMKKFWNRSLPFKKNEKCARPTFRATKTGTLLQDISYYCVIEITGTLSKITRGFSLLTNTEASPPIDDPRYLSGMHRGEAVIHRKNCYPYHCVGPVWYLWMPEAQSSTECVIDDGLESGKRRLWVCAHPACKNDILEALLDVFKDNKVVSVTSIKDQLSIFRITGAKSSLTLSEVITSKDRAVKEAIRCDFAMSNDVISEDVMNQSVFAVQSQYPELHQKVNTASQALPDVPDKAGPLRDYPPVSPLWYDDKRRTLLMHVAEKTRGKMLLPGFKIDTEEDDEEATIPLLLLYEAPKPRALQTPPCWQIIVPSSAAMLFWKAIVYRGVRIVGMTEWQSICLEYGIPIYPYSVPDSPASKQFSIEERDREAEIYSKRPPGKRPNFQTLGVEDPFICAWAKLVQNWVGSNDYCDYFVLRNRKHLQTLKLALDNNRRSFGELKGMVSQFTNSLVPVTVKAVRGALEKNCMICLPTDDDIEVYQDKGTAPVKKPLKAKVKGKSAVVEEDARRVFGSLHLAGFCLSQGGCAGQGFVCFPGLVELLNSGSSGSNSNGSHLVLVRSPTSLFYRFATLTVDVEPL